MRILIVDGDPPRSELLAAVHACPGAEAHCVAVRDARRTFDQTAPRAVVLGPGAADRPDAPELVAAFDARRPDVPVLVASARDGAAAAVAAMKAGAAEYVVLGNGTGTRALADALARAMAAGERPARRPPRPAAGAPAAALAGLVGQSAAIARVRDLVRTAAGTEAPVLVEGETGTGKEVVARAVHALGRRARGPFVPVNCAAVPETLAESEFFGHARGAFTGAVQERPGVVQLADRGTLFLDEVEDLTPALQAKLLRVVQDREVRPLGASAARRMDVRLVAAANRDLAGMVEAGTFRRDLYYRLRVLSIRVPPLRHRREDVPLLVAHFIARFNAAHGTAFRPPPPAALRPFLEHQWPGNVRELENTLESLLILAGAADTDLPGLLARHAPGTDFPVDDRARILRALEAHRWNRQRAAGALGISRVTLWRRMERHGIRDPLDADGRETA